MICIYRLFDIYREIDILSGKNSMGRSKQDEGAIRLSALEENLLALLIGKELYGLAIIDALEEVIGRSLSVGSLYPALHKMEKRGLIRSWWGEETPEERGHARRRYYTATGLGEQALKAIERKRQQLAQWQPAWGRA
jgi:DNA-binding PadR family transcriptional regulator